MGEERNKETKEIKKENNKERRLISVFRTRLPRVMRARLVLRRKRN